MSKDAREKCILKNIDDDDEESIRANDILITSAIYLCIMRILCFAVTFIGLSIKKLKYGGTYYK